MQETGFDNILAKAIEAKNTQQDWHHHYLPPGCLLNTGEKHALVLETNREASVAYFDEKPLQKLEQLENLFFDR